MRSTPVWLFLGVLVIFSACVPNQKIVYLQKNDVKDYSPVLDSSVRSYTPVPFDYKIQPNDALYVNFQSLTPEEFDFLNNNAQTSVGGQSVQLRSELVDPDGKISFPGVGKVKVSGLTVFQIQDTLQQMANQYLKSPSVRVRLVNFRFTLLGEVMSEGTITTLDNRVSLPEALGLGGGLSELASRSNIKIIRQRNGKTEVGYVNLLSEDIMESPFYYVNQNDVIVVPPLRQRPFRKYFGQNLGIILSATSVILLIFSITN